MGLLKGKELKLKVQVMIKNVYGRDLIYPINGLATKFASLLDKKTFQKSDLEKIKDLGFEVELVNTLTLDLKSSTKRK
jgi:hypothetical protein